MRSLAKCQLGTATAPGKEGSGDSRHWSGLGTLGLDV